MESRLVSGSFKSFSRSKGRQAPRLLEAIRPRANRRAREGKHLKGHRRLFVRLLPSRVGFAERDASRPAFGGSSLVSLTRHTCVGGGPIGGALSVRVSVRVLRSRSRQTIPAHRPKEGTNDHEPSAASECAGARVVSSISLRSRLDPRAPREGRACCGAK